MADLIQPMEVLLNTFWLLIAVGAFLFWRPEKQRGVRAGRHYGRSLAMVALACALVLLFPVISLTDDLHAEQAAMEDSSRSVMKARQMMQACLHAGKSHSMPAVDGAAYSAAALHRFPGAAVFFETRVPCRPPLSAHEGRSPPSHV